MPSSRPLPTPPRAQHHTSDDDAFASPATLYHLSIPLRTGSQDQPPLPPPGGAPPAVSQPGQGAAAMEGGGGDDMRDDESVTSMGSNSYVHHFCLPSPSPVLPPSLPPCMSLPHGPGGCIVLIAAQPGLLIQQLTDSCQSLPPSFQDPLQPPLDHQEPVLRPDRFPRPQLCAGQPSLRGQGDPCTSCAFGLSL